MTSTPPPKDPSPDRLRQTLEAAHRPSDLSEERHEAILAQVLGLEVRGASSELVADPSAEEQACAQRLAEALEGNGHHELERLATVLSCADAPTELSELGLARALGKLNASDRGPERIALAPPRLKSTIGATLTVLALAATVVLALRARQEAVTGQPSDSAFALSRSLSPLFVEPSNHGTATTRMDRIVMARSRDLRQNRYVSWRVR